MVLQEKLDEHVSLSMNKLDEVLKREEPPYWTQNAHLLGTNYEQWLEFFQGVHRRRDQYIYGSTSFCGSDAPSLAPSSHPIYAGAQWTSCCVSCSLINIFTWAPAPVPRAPEAFVQHDPEAEAVRVLRKIHAYRHVVAADLPRLLRTWKGSDVIEFNDELKVMAGVRSYFQVAYKVCHIAGLYRVCVIVPWS